MINNTIKRPAAQAKHSMIRAKAVIAVLVIWGNLTLSTDAALIDIENLNGAQTGAYAFVNDAGVFLPDPSAEIFFGAFITTTQTIAAIQTAFTTDFSALAADFTSIGSVGVEKDGPLISGVTGVHTSSNGGLNAVPVIGRNLALWVTTSGTVNDGSAQHLIYLTSQMFLADVVAAPEQTYTALFRSMGDGGNGEVAVGGFGLFTKDVGGGGGAFSAFNTVAVVPEPGTFGILIGLGLVGMLIHRRRRSSAPRSPA